MVIVYFLIYVFLSKLFDLLHSLRILVAIGALPGLISPLLPDYVYKESQGLANSYVIIIFLNPLLIIV